MAGASKVRAGRKPIQSTIGKRNIMENHTLAVAVVQMCSTDDYAANLLKIGRAVRAAAKRGVDLIAFPENALSLRAEGEKINWTPEIEAKLIGHLEKLANDAGAAILVGSMPEAIKGSKKFFNTSLLISRQGKVIGRYRKIHLFDATLPDGTVLSESRFIQPGKAVANAILQNWNIGMSICYDLRFPELYRRLRKNHAHILVVPSAFTVPTGKAHWEVLLRARAIENQCYVIAPAQTGVHSPTRESYGHSLVINPWGEIVASSGAKETIIYAALDRALVHAVRERMQVWNHRVLNI